MMSDEIRIPVTMPLDDDGFLRRECPTCEQEFKWFRHEEGDTNAELASQYFCPLCGEPAAVDQWWTRAQIDYGYASGGPAIDRAVQDAVAGLFRGMRGLDFKPNSSFSLGFEAPDALIEANDMVILEPPCHPNEPVKVPEEHAEHAYCLVCGSEFAS